MPERDSPQRPCLYPLCMPSALSPMALVWSLEFDFFVSSKLVISLGLSEIPPEVELFFNFGV